MSRYIITAGSRYTDIDVLACAHAYHELLHLSGENSVVVLPGVLNNTIPPMAHRWVGHHEKEYVPCANDSFILVDVSDPTHFAPFVDVNRVEELYDHHFGFEEFWKNRLGDRAKVESVGSCATLIWEEFQRRGVCENISPKNANLLSASILSNTLNFKASVTSDRDRHAFEQVQDSCELGDGWMENYFHEVESDICANPLKAIQSDTKEVTLDGSCCQIAQLELWDANSLLGQDGFIENVEEHFSTTGDGCWLLSIPCISEGRNYFFCKNARVKQLLINLFAVEFDDKGLARTEHLYLRKEILKQLLLNQKLVSSVL